MVVPTLSALTGDGGSTTPLLAMRLDDACMEGHLECSTLQELSIDSWILRCPHHHATSSSFFPGAMTCKYGSEARRRLNMQRLLTT